MEYQHILALLTFAFVSTASPGPNNIMLMTSGANVGVKQTVPHMAGIVIGFAVMVILVGVGLMGMFTRYPMLHQGMQFVSIAYLVYLAWKIARSRAEAQSFDGFKPMSFIAAANFQWVNPKAWSMAITAISVYNVTANWQGVLLVSLAFTVVNVPSVLIWTVAGKQLQLLLTNPKRIQGFNYSMAALLLIAVLPMLG
ncbi:LysE family translocator [Thaumasiovibrio subtropicus]|uniref:LysE family translocator n=1 Tax=Thaumasiovibrio subtropicus TaxID=1891207 RepID=UPI000B354A26|nr:LysE family translocator [Thaumasiovibrio subtropicus]